MGRVLKGESPSAWDLGLPSVLCVLLAAVSIAYVTYSLQRAATK
jgi:hypothetical protein